MAKADVIYPYSVRQGNDLDADIKYVVRNVLGGAWEGTSPQDITLTPVGGGITNLLFKAAGPAEMPPVLVRIYGEGTDILIDREKDNNLFHELASFGFAPPYLGRFLNGRIEGYLAARALQPEEMGLRSPVDFVSLIAREMARLHRLPVTTAGPQGEAEVWSTLPRWLALAMDVKFEDEVKAAAVSRLKLDRVKDEVAWLERELRASADASNHDRWNGNTRARASGPEEPLEDGALAPAESRQSNGPGSNGGTAKREDEQVEEQARRYLSEVVLSHNDLLSGNVMYADGWDKVQVIDYEYSGYNPRGFDIANHFCEHAGFDSNFAESYPSHETQLAFMRAYLEASERLSKAAGGECSGEPQSESSGHDAVKKTEDVGGTVSETGTASACGGQAFAVALRKEVDRWTLASHLWWAIWAVIQARHSPIDFNFVDYARLRLEGYDFHKKAFFGDEKVS